MENKKFCVSIDTENPQTPLFQKRFNDNRIWSDGWGIEKIIQILNKFNVQGNFFFNPYEYTIWGRQEMDVIAKYIHQNGHLVELHTHPIWVDEIRRENMFQFSFQDQLSIINWGLDFIESATGRRPNVHRAGAYGYNESTVKALRHAGVLADSSNFWKHPFSQHQITQNQIIIDQNVVELPITCFDRGDKVVKTDLDWMTQNELIDFANKLDHNQSDYYHLMLHSYSLTSTDDQFKTFKPAPEQAQKLEQTLEYLLSNNFEPRTMESLALDYLNTQPKMHVESENQECYKILFVQDAPCIRNYKYATALKERGHEVTLAYTKFPLSQRYPGLSDTTYFNNIHLSDWDELPTITHNYDIVHCHNEPDFPTIFALNGPTPVIHDTHDLISLRTHQQNLEINKYERIANTSSQGRIYSTPYQRDEAAELHGVQGPSEIFYNYASEADLPKKFLPKLSDKDGLIHLVYMGGISAPGNPNSAHRDFGWQFEEITQMNGVIIHIYPAAFDPKLAQHFAQFPQIDYRKPVSPKILLQEMTQFDIGIIPWNLKSANKRFLDSTIANKLFEYLAAGIPVATASIKSYVDFFSKTPVGMTFDSPQDLISKLPQLRRLARTIEFKDHIYTYERQIDRLEKFYDKIIQTSKR